MRNTHTQTIIEENGKQTLYGVRLKVDKETISEIEAIIIRGKGVLDAKAILDTKGQNIVDMAHGPRRFLVDVETGTVVAYVLLGNMGPDFHMFKMRNGQVEWIQTYFDHNTEKIRIDRLAD